ARRAGVGAGHLRVRPAPVHEDQVLRRVVGHRRPPRRPLHGVLLGRPDALLFRVIPSRASVRCIADTPRRTPPAAAHAPPSPARARAGPGLAPRPAPPPPAPAARGRRLPGPPARPPAAARARRSPPPAGGAPTARAWRAPR